LHRRRLGNVAFIGVTGSCAKTTTKELIAAVLGGERRGRKTPGEGNGLAVVSKTVLRTTRRDAFCVAEVAAGGPSDVMRATRMLRPDIAVVTRIGADHRKAFRTLEATAAEKRQLLVGAAEGATAILNRDDPRVIAMADGFAGRVVTFGRSPDADLRAADIRGGWPERLSFTLIHGGRRLAVHTRLCGMHWTESVLAALSVAAAMNISLERAIAALAAVPPTPARMSPLSGNGVTFIRDDVKAPLWAIDTAFEFLAQARSARKIAVIGTISDHSASSSYVYPSVARRALAVADEVVFVGPNARQAMKLKDRERSGALRAFATALEAADHLQATVRAGDLVLIKGSGKTDKLGQVVPSWACPDG
jgi:UDP-N-acetylmuramyl pentapeptide synthase